MLWTDFMGRVNKIPVLVSCFTLLIVFSAIQKGTAEDSTPPVLVCDDQINVSLNENCEAVVTVGMVLEGESTIPNYDPGNYTIDIEGVPGNILTEVGIYTVTITEKDPPFSPPLNSCWGHILVEDKLPPRINPESCDCPEGNTDPDCVLPLLCDELAEILDGSVDVPMPEVIENCSAVTISFRDEIFDNGNCSETVVKRIWIYMDAGGNKVESCPFYYRIIPITLSNDVVGPKKNVLLDCGVGTSPQEIYNYFAQKYRDENPCDTLPGQCDPASPFYDPDRVEEYEEEVHAYALMFSYPSIHGLPLINHICNTATTYTDVVIPICSSAPECNDNIKIIREWKIYDWCASILEPIEFTQVIKASDNTPPHIKVKDFKTSVDPWGCRAKFYFPDPIHLSDNCTSFVRYEVTAALGTGIQVKYDPDRGYFVDDLPVGTYQFFYHAYDCCDNVTSAGIYVTVADKTPPVAITKQDIVVTLIPNHSNDTIEGLTKIFAESVDNGSFDGCSPVKLEIRRENGVCGLTGNTTYNNDGHSNDHEDDLDNGRFVKFCCNDLTEFGIDANGDGVIDYAQIKVWLRVWDDGDGDGIFGTAGDNFSEVWSWIRLEDKSRPSIHCPPDITIDCDADEHFLHDAGEAKAYGSCGNVEVDYIDITTDMTSCNIGTIIRKWFVVGYEDVFCFQYITKKDEHFGPPIITFPNDTVIDCNDVLNEVPTWIAGPCDLLGYSVSRDTFYFEEGACFKIVNYWTVIDWCIYDPDDVIHSGGIWNDIQIVKIIDHVAPTIDACHDRVFEADDKPDLDGDGILCENNTVILSNSATDNGDCASNWLKWTVQVDLYGDWNIDYIFSSAAPAGSTFYLPHTSSGEEVRVVLPEGVLGSMANHRVVWKVSDGCGNITTCTTYFMVVDKIPPTPYCIDLSTALMENGQVELWACDFDLGAFDNCTPQEDLRFTFSDVPPSQDPSFNPLIGCSSMIFTCDDLIASGGSPITINVYVWDSKGNFDFCSVRLKLVDNQDSCEDVGSSPTAQIGGTVQTAKGDLLENVALELMSVQPTYPKNKMTDGSGHYMFPDNDMYQDYSIRAHKEDNPLNGVSTLDLLLMQKHILGIEKLDSPHKLIAADINNDGKITAIDLIELRKLILGIYSDFPNNQSWNMVVESSISDPLAPWNYSSERQIADLDNNMMQEDFMAVKTGDVNGSAKVNLLENSETVQAKAVEISYEDHNYRAGDVFETEFMMRGSDIEGFQFTLNSQGLQIMDIYSNSASFNNRNFAVHGEKTTISWNNEYAEDELEYIVIRYEAHADGLLSENISLSSAITEAEAYSSKDLDIIPLKLTGRNNPEQEFKLYQNNPNPFKGRTNIEFYLPQDQTVTMQIFDITGRVLWSTTKAFNEGMNTIEISKSDLNVNGILYYRMDAGDFTDSKKMIILE